MSVQTTYTLAPDLAVPGQVQNRPNADIESRSLAAAAGCDAGVFVKHGTTWQTADVISDTGDVSGECIGVVCAKQMREPNTSIARFKQRDTLEILTKGEIWVKCHGAVTDDMKNVYVVHENAGSVLAAGQIRADVGSGDYEATLLPGVKVRKGAAAGNLALVYVNLGPVGPTGPQGEQGEPGGG